MTRSPFTSPGAAVDPAVRLRQGIPVVFIARNSQGPGLVGLGGREPPAYRERQSVGRARLSERPTKFSRMRSALSVPLEGLPRLSARSLETLCRSAYKVLASSPLHNMIQMGPSAYLTLP